MNEGRHQFSLSGGRTLSGTGRFFFQLLISVLPIVALTMGPGEVSFRELLHGPNLCLACGSREASDGLLNLLLFVPFGWVAGGRNGVVRTAGWGLLASVAIEGAQLLIPGRFSSAADLLANSLGAGLGAWIRARHRLPVRTAAWGVVLALFSPAFLSAPRPPIDGDYFGQWTAALGSMDRYRGQVLDARVGHLFVPSRRSEETSGIQAALSSGAPVRVRVRAGPAPRREAPVFSIYDDRQQEMFMLGAYGNDVFVRIWRVGTTLRFQTPTWWWEDALAGVSAGDSLLITFSLGDRAPCLNVDGRARCLSASADLGSWSLLAPGLRNGPLVTVVGLLWAFLLGAPFGMLSLNGRGKTILATGLGVAVAVVSTALPYWVTPWWGLLLMFGGMMVASRMEPWIRKTLER